GGGMVLEETDAHDQVLSCIHTQANSANKAERSDYIGGAETLPRAGCAGCSFGCWRASGRLLASVGESARRGPWHVGLTPRRSHLPQAGGTSDCATPDGAAVS